MSHTKKFQLTAHTNGGQSVHFHSDGNAAFVSAATGDVGQSHVKLPHSLLRSLCRDFMRWDHERINGNETGARDAWGVDSVRDGWSCCGCNLFVGRDDDWRARHEHEMLLDGGACNCHAFDPCLASRDDLTRIGVRAGLERIVDAVDHPETDASLRARILRSLRKVGHVTAPHRLSPVAQFDGLVEVAKGRRLDDLAELCGVERDEEGTIETDDSLRRRALEALQGTPAAERDEAREEHETAAAALVRHPWGIPLGRRPK